MKNIGKSPTRARLAFVVALAIVATAWTAASAQAYPDRVIKLILGFGVGGPTDIVARTLADQLTKEFGQRVVVENKTGASGNIATRAVASADPDGYTYLVGANPLAVNHSLFPDFDVKFGRDIVAVAPIGANANVLVVRPSLDVHTLAEFVARARTKPEAMSYATVASAPPRTSPPSPSVSAPAPLCCRSLIVAVARRSRTCSPAASTLGLRRSPRCSAR